MRAVMAAATVLAALWVAPVNAQVMVQDNASLLQQAKDYFQLIKSYGTQLSQLQQEIQTAETTLNMLNSFVQNPSLGAAMGLMSSVGLGSALPINPYALQSLVSGYGGLQSKLGALSSLSNSSFATNSVYTCTDNSWACQQLQQRAAGNAGQQAISMNAIQTAAAHLPVLQAIRERLATSTTPAERDNAMAALQTESAWANQENTRMMAANIMITSQNDIRDQRANEKMSKDLQATIDSIPQ